jgi:hypothetical protein
MNPRRHRRSVWMLLAWFTLSLALAMASPALEARAAHHHCEEAAEDGAAPAAEHSAHTPAGHLHHCVMCGLLGGPPAAFEFAAHRLPAAAPVPRLTAGVVARSAAPLWARGPPLP